LIATLTTVDYVNTERGKIMDKDQEGCQHAWVAGMMYVHPEDLDYVASVRPVACEKCDEVYQADKEE